MKRIRILLLLLFMSMVSGPWTRAQSKPEIISFDAPGAGAGAFQGTYAYAINPAGVITGWYLDDNNQGWGFLRAPDGAITSFSVPNAGTGPFLGTGAWSINQAGETAGFYADVNCVAHGFVRTSGGQTKEFDAPGTGTATAACIQFNPSDMQGTAALDINAAGETAGVTIDTNNVEHGFVRTPSGTITVFDAPGAGTAPFQGTFPTVVSGLNSSGTVAGTYFDSDSVYHGFLRRPDGKFVTFEAPGAGTNAYQGTYVTSINSEEQTVGVYFDANNVQHGFVRSPNGVINTIDVPGAGTGAYQGTVADVNNDAGTIAGNYFDTNGAFHGFVRAANGKITTFDAPGAGDGAFQGTAPVAITPQGVIAGYYTDANNANHGFLRLPDAPCN